MKKKTKKLVATILTIVGGIAGIVLIVLSFLLPGKTYKGKFKVSDKEHEIAYKFSSHQVTQYIDDEETILKDFEWRNEDGMIQVNAIIKWQDIGKPIGPTFVTANPYDQDDKIVLVSGGAIAELVSGIVVLGICISRLVRKK